MKYLMKEFVQTFNTSSKKTVWNHKPLEGYGRHEHPRKIKNKEFKENILPHSI